MAEKKKYNSILISGRKDQTLTYSKYVKDEESGESVKESLDKKVNVTDELTTQQIKDGAITNEKMAADSVGNTNLQDGSVSNEKLEDGSITNDKLAENSITKDKLQDKTIGVEKLDNELRQAIAAATGLPENLVETIQNVDDTLRDHQSQLDDKQSQIDDKQQQITANDEDISLLQTRSTQIEETIKSIAATGGASQATAVTYDNAKSGLDAVNIQSAIDEIINNLGHYETNEEWLRAYTDTEGKFLWGIRVDGSIDWSVGIPTPIRTKLQEIVTKCQQDKTDLTEAIATAKNELISSLQTYQQTTDASIAKLQEGKVDKEEGKSLIEDEVKECFRVIENEEFIKAIVDSEDKVLFGFYRATGKPYFPLNEMYHVYQNEEFFALWLDANDKVLLGIRRDGQIIGEIHAVNALKQVISQLQSDLASLQEKVGTIDTNLKELIDVFSLQENPEYMAVEKDADDKVLSATYNDGSHYIHNAKSETIPTEFEHIEDPEGRFEITLDAESKLLGYRDSKGIRYEQSMQIDHFYKNGIEINYASEDYVNNKPLDEDKIHISKLEGVKDYSYPNLFNSRSIQKYDSAFADKVYEAIGRKTGETGCYSNFIDCKEGDWFTRNDFGTGIVVVCDGKRNIIGDVKDVAYKPTFQIKASEGQDFSEVRYVVMVVMLANINSQRIVKAKYITDRTEDTLRIPKLRIGQDNLEMGVVPYIKATSGNFYSLSIDDRTSPQIVLDKLDGIPASELPNDFPKFSFSGDFSEYLDSLVMCPIEGGETYLFELGKNGLVKRYLNKKVNCARVIKESGTTYIYGCDGGLNTSSGRLNILRANNHTFDVVKSNIISSDGQLLEPHDCLVLSVSPLHIITQSYIPNQTTVVDGVSKKITSLHIEEQYEGKRICIWKSEAHPDLWKDSHDQADNADYLHNNTICLTTEGNVMLNNKHANQILILERTWNESSHTGTIGDILYKVGGDHNKVSYDVSNRIKTTEEQQWFESHDAEMREDGSITMFDNEPSYPSRILDFKIDTVNKCLKDFKSYSFEKYHGRYMGSAQKLADGVYLVSWGSVRDGGTPNLGIYDFNKNKKIFELKFDALAYSTYRVYGITV